MNDFNVRPFWQKVLITLFVLAMPFLCSITEIN